MNISRDELYRVIRELKQKILEVERSSQKISEQDTRQGLINPLLQVLGWDLADFDIVRCEFRPPGFRDAMDYVFFYLTDKEKPALLIEAKRLGTNLNNGKIIKQLCANMGQAGAQWGILTDGNKYVMYNSAASSNFEEQKYLTLQISAVDTDDGLPIDQLADQLIAVISRNSLERNNIQEFYKKQAINIHVEEAMCSLFSEPFDTLAQAIQREFKQERVADPSLRITKKQIIEYIESMKDEEGRLPVQLDDISSYAPPCDSHDVGRNVKRYVKITDLLNKGLIQPGDNWKMTYKGEITWGRITANGKLQINDKAYLTPSAAASAVTGRSCSGWNCWHFKDEHGHWLKISVLRDEWEKLQQDR
ncbi:MAG: type I restriction enzyme HsdR N-terminal domain-containing protein [Pseudomonadota bacterium]|nr:type I restriction enzyme HsdR N-terminal domain-containing protein [Pseudomonadota bacterium]